MSRFNLSALAVRERSITLFLIILSLPLPARVHTIRESPTLET